MQDNFDPEVEKASLDSDSHPNAIVHTQHRPDRGVIDFMRDSSFRGCKIWPDLVDCCRISDARATGDGPRDARPSTRERTTMLDQVLDNFRKASETSMQMQQEMLKKWMGQWPTSTPTNPGAAWAEQALSFQKRRLESVTEVMNQHREKL